MISWLLMYGIMFSSVVRSVLRYYCFNTPDGEWVSVCHENSKNWTQFCFCMIIIYKVLHCSNLQMVSRHFHDEGFQDRLIPSPTGTDLHFLAPTFKITEIEIFRIETDDVWHDILHQIVINLHWNQMRQNMEDFYYIHWHTTTSFIRCPRAWERWDEWRILRAVDDIECENMALRSWNESLNIRSKYRGF